ncbi:MAG: hypothetical protein R3C60_02365 [Parvularculaceae bacterium]
MTAEFEKIIVDPHPIDAERFGEQARRQNFSSVSRRSIFGLLETTPRHR